jgi:hypothetical protein
MEDDIAFEDGILTDRASSVVSATLQLSRDVVIYRSVAATKRRRKLLSRCLSRSLSATTFARVRFVAMAADYAIEGALPLLDYLLARRSQTG